MAAVPAKCFALVDPSDAVIATFTSLEAAHQTLRKYRVVICFGGEARLTPPGDKAPIIDQLRFHYKHCNGDMERGIGEHPTRSWQICHDCGLMAYDDEVAPVMAQLIN